MFFFKNYEFAILISFLIYKSFESISTTKKWNKRSNSTLPFYHHSGIHFLKHYGKKYGLFEFFFDNTPSIVYPSESSDTYINDSYRVRNYFNYAEWEVIAMADLNVWISDTSNYPRIGDAHVGKARDVYIPDKERGNSYRYNNKYRFGPGPWERFLSIFFKGDPWDSNGKEPVIRFVSYEVRLNSSFQYYCNYTYPAVASVRFEGSNFCPIPNEVKLLLTKDVTEVKFDFICRSSVVGWENRVLIPNIQVRRLHRMDRRHFNTTACTMINNVNSYQLKEWLVYNLAIGIEHFYLFDNRKIFPTSSDPVLINQPDTTRSDGYLTESVLKPFLDANLVTLVYFPFSPDTDRDWNKVQFSSIITMFEQFGHYSKWLGLFDIDEFFVASKNMQELLLLTNKKPSGSIHLLGDLLTTLEESKTVKRIRPSERPGSTWFHMQDMDCKNKDYSEGYRAISTNCNTDGIFFRQYDWVDGTPKMNWSDGRHGHGKIFVKTSIQPTYVVEMPHMVWGYPSVLADEDTGGFFCHFNNLRYTKHVMAKDSSLKPIDGDYRLRQFTLTFLDAVLGVRVKGTESISRLDSGKSKNNNQPEFKDYYTKNGIQFLREYGKKYDLFRIFFSHPEHANDIVYPKESVDKSISEQFLVRDYSHYNNWELLASVDTNSKFVNDKSRYTKSISRMSNISSINNFLKYNNRFRFGEGLQNRYHSIFFRKDPWVDKDATISFATSDSPSVKANTYCRIVSPVNVDIPLENDAIHFCKIPSIVRKALTEKITSITFHLIQKSANSDTKDNIVTLLSNIKVSRLHHLDRRYFNVTVCTMIDEINSYRIKEWLVHNLVLGVEHFYIFDNRKVYLNESTSSDLEVDNSIIKPFLDANLVTLIYYPYCRDDEREWNSIQFSSFNVVLRQFGHYSKWLGMYDIDEFFVASKNMQELLLTSAKQLGSVNLIGDLLTTLEESKTAKHIRPGFPIGSAWFHMQDMDCKNKDYSKGYRAISTHCNTDGIFFRQYDWINETAFLNWNDGRHGHGKIFVKPFIEDYYIEANMPHMIWNHAAVLGEEDRDGFFCHFNDLRYTKHAQDRDSSVKYIDGDYRLKDFTTIIFKKILDIVL